MTMFTVYLFTQWTTDIAAPMMQRRERALIVLREELLRLGGVCVSPSPQDADLQVELLNLAGAGDGAAAQRPDLRAERRRILIVRVWKDTERFDLVCSDGPNDVSAEHQAARRIQASAERTAARPAQQFETLPADPC